MTHADICQLHLHRTEQALFTSTNYKAYVSVGLHAQSVNKVKCLIDMGAVPNVIKKSFVNQNWVPRVKRRGFLKLRSANKQSIRSERDILLLLQIGDLRIYLWFKVVKDLTIDLLLGTSFIHRYVRGTFISKSKLVPWLLRPVDIPI